MAKKEIHFSTTLKRFFQKKILYWEEKENQRQLPWKGISNPYHIWVSEIMLQQTQAKTVIPYYKKFIQKFPTITDLANANKQEVFALWQGLGFYRRCENLIFACKDLHAKNIFQLPADYDFILSLKGVGEYTAAAISSFAFNLPHAVADTNVKRIVRRFLGVDQHHALKLIQGLAPKQHIKKYNQAIMDFGATICTAKSPACEQCLLKKKCKAYKQPELYLNEKNKKTLAKKNVYFYFFIITDKAIKNIFITQIREETFWKNLYMPPFIALSKKASLQKIKQLFIEKYKIKQHPLTLKASSKTFKQVLSHRNIKAKYYHLGGELHQLDDCDHIPIKHLHQFGFPKIALDILQKVFSK